MLQADIGDLRAAEVQRLELRQSLQMLQAGIGDLRAERSNTWSCQSLQMLQARVGDLVLSRSSPS